MGEFWYHFSRKKLAFFSAILFCAIFILSLFAPFIANDRAILIYKDSRFYFPIFVDYVESDFVDLRSLDSHKSGVNSSESNAVFAFGIDYRIISVRD